jgi:ParB/RepB/Spo0J family partition protein
MAHLETVSVAEIGTSPDNTRRFDRKDKEDKATLEELAASIRELGLQQPPKVRPNAAGRPPWVLVFGERRLRAVRDILKWTRITVLVDDEMAGENASAATVVENLQRRDLHPMDEARGIAILRGQGKTIKEISKRVGRREEWVKERLKLCALPAEAQDLYRHSATMTLGQAQDLHDYTHGGKDNKGFPALIVAIAREMAAGMTGSAALGSFTHAHPDLLLPMQHAYGDESGRWNGNYFDTRDICTRCPFAAYRPGYYNGVGYCLMPTHYAELKAKGKETYDAAVAALQAEAEAAQAAGGDVAPTTRPPWQTPPVETAAEKGKKTRQRHKDQTASYAPNVAAIERAIDMIPAVDTIDVAVLCAYTLTLKHVDREAIKQVIKRHNLSSFPGPEPTPSRSQIERLRLFDGVALVRYTLEALLLTQAMRVRDYDPGRTPADPVLALYLPGQAVPTPAEVIASLGDADDDDMTDLTGKGVIDEGEEGAA